MMNWLAAADVWLFRLVNESFANPWCDYVFATLGYVGELKLPLALIAAALLLGFGGFRGRVYVLLALLCVGIGDPLAVNSIKKSVARPRPYQCLENVRQANWHNGALTVSHTSLGPGRPRSMPSSHVANSVTLTLAAALVFGWRRWRWLLLWPLLMMISRVYTGDHFPLDTLAGLLLGAAYTWLICCIADKLWQTFARRLAPKFYEQHPALLAGRGR